jgi:hypothetical protein
MAKAIRLLIKNGTLIDGSGGDPVPRLASDEYLRALPLPRQRHIARSFDLRT